MKEASGEANLTVVTIILIALVLAVGTVVVRTALNSMGKKSACTNIGGVMKGTKCHVEGPFRLGSHEYGTKDGEILTCKSAGFSKGYYVKLSDSTSNGDAQAQCK